MAFVKNSSSWINVVFVSVLRRISEQVSDLCKVRGFSDTGAAVGVIAFSYQAQGFGKKNQIFSFEVLFGSSFSNSFLQ
jgi:hypothetical protein